MPNRNASVAAFALLFFLNCADDEHRKSPIGNTSISGGILALSAKFLQNDQDQLDGIVNFGEVAMGTNVTTTLAISNLSSEAIINLGAIVATTQGRREPTGDAGGAFSVGPIRSGSQVIALNASVFADLSFSPTGSERTDYLGELVVTTTAGQSVTLSLKGTGTAVVAATRIIGLSGDMAFGNVAVGANATTTLTISNSGNSTLTWSGLSTGDATVTASATSGTVAAGASENVTLTFTPTAATSLNSTLTVTNNATSGTNTIALTAEVLSAATRIIGLSGDFDFGDVAVGASATSTLTITNTGDSTLTWVAPQEDSDGVFTTEPHSGTVDPGGGTGTTTVTFSPRDVRSYSRSQRMTGNKTSGTDTYTLTGTGTAAAATRIIGLSGPGDAATVAFGNVAELTSINRTLTIANTGNSTLTLTRIDIGDSHYSASPTSGTVAAGAQLTVTVTFVPSERKEHPATLAVTSDKTSGNEMIAVTGMGCDALAEGCVSGT
jgi:hypothetical protein